MAAYFVKVELNSESYKINTNEIKFVKFDRSLNTIEVFLKDGAIINFSSDDLGELENIFSKFPS